MKTYSRCVKSPCPIRDQNLPDEYENSCRLCLTKDNMMIDIYNEDEIVPIPLKLRYCISLEVTEEDGLPCGICTDCMVKLDETYAFKKRCLATDVKLRQFLHVPTFSNNFNLDDRSSKDTTLAGNGDNGGNSRDACTIKLEENGLLFINELCRRSNINKNNDTGNNSISDIASSVIEVNNLNIEDNLDNYKTADEVSLDINSFCNGDSEKNSNIEELHESLNVSSQNIVTVEETGSIIFSGKKLVDLSQSVKSYSNEESKIENESTGTENSKGECDNEEFSVSGFGVGKKTGRTAYRCTPCNLPFYDHKDLLNHKHSQHAETIKMCNFCPKTFMTNSTLERHLRTHTGDRPYGCDSCGKWFSQKEILNRHSVVHDLDKRRSARCGVCNYTCSSAEKLHRHIKLRHSNGDLKDQLPKFPCNKCNKAFYHPSGLSRHQAAHSGVMFQCVSCMKPFSDKSSVKRHFSKTHPSQLYRINEGPFKCYQIARYEY